MRKSKNVVKRRTLIKRYRKSC